MKKTLRLLYVVLLLILSAVGCSQPVRPASAVKDDLLGSPHFYSAPDVTITNFKVTKRSQEPKSKTEYVRASVSVESPGGSGELYYLMTYVLKTEGWVLNTIAPDDEKPWIFTPNRITADAANKILQEKYGESYHILNQEESDTLTSVFSYAKTNSSAYMDQDVNGRMTFTFDEATALWNEPTYEEEASAEVWKVAGDWEFHAEIPYYATNDITTYTFNMKITSFDGKTCSASYNIVEEFRDNGLIYSKSESGIFETTSEENFYYEIESVTNGVYAFSIDKDKGVVVRFPDASGPCKFIATP